jgi:hypothetical protein
LGKKDLGTTEFPPIETALVDGDIAFRQHSGGHTPSPNWPTFLTFASRYIKRPAVPGAQSNPVSESKVGRFPRQTEALRPADSRSSLGQVGF